MDMVDSPNTEHREKNELLHNWLILLIAIWDNQHDDERLDLIKRLAEFVRAVSTVMMQCDLIYK